MMCNTEIYRQKTGREASEGKTSATILPYVNLLLMMYVGAGLVISAELYLDPTPSSLLGVVPAELAERLPTAALLGAASLLTLLLALLLPAALATTRRSVLYTYSVGMSLLVMCEAGAAAWHGWQAYSYFADNPDKWLKQELSAKPYVAGALLALWVVLQIVGAVLAALAPPAAASQPDESKQTNTLLLSCMGPTSNMPRCLRPLSGADYMPSSYMVRESDSSRRSMRSKGWQLQPQVGWKQG